MPTLLQALMQRHAHPATKAVVEQFSPECVELYSGVFEKTVLSPELCCVLPDRILTELHSSWYEELIAFCPEVLRTAIRQALVDRSQKKAYSDPVRSFLLMYLVNKWPEKSTLPIECVEETPLHWIVDSDEKTVMALIDVLALYGILDDLRRTVDKKILDEVDKRLSALQRQFMKSILQTVSPPQKLAIRLNSILKMDPKESRKILHRHGLQRMASALHAAPTLLMWHFLHRLPRDQAMTIQSAMQEKKYDEILAKKQLLHAYQFLKRVRKS
jgi:hypothetical protein